MKFALAGNPNSGKTTLFNSLTGSTAKTGNWSGVTVESRVGKYKKLDKVVDIIDLPGIYSLSPYTAEEEVARNYILNEGPDLIVNIIDVTNLERNLYLTTQILETDCPVVLALNMMDVLKENGSQINIEELQKRLGVPVVPISALREEGISELMKIAYTETKKRRKPFSILSDSSISNNFEEIANLVEKSIDKNTLFHATKLLEGDLIERKTSPVLSENVERLKDSIEIDSYLEGDFEAFIANERYKYIEKNFSTLLKDNKPNNELTKSDKIDKILTHKVFSIPIFLGFMFLIFHLTFGEKLFYISENIPSPGVLLQGWTEVFIEFVSSGIDKLLVTLGASDWILGLVIDGIVAGVGAVLTFLPQIMILFLFLSIMEDSGYMARVAFIMDRLLRRFGLSGKAFMPLLMGFGCSIPAMMGTRTLETDNEKRLTIMLMPFFSCGAKLPIWAMFASAFSPKNPDLLITGVYILGIAVAIVVSAILKKFMFKGSVGHFIIELPTYHMPRLKNTVIYMWDKLKGFVTRVTTIIAGATIIIWFLSNFNFKLQMVDSNSANSILGILGSILKPIFIPLGFVSGSNGWKAIVAILTGLIAKEMVVSTMGVLYNPSIGGDALEDNTANTALIATLTATFSLPAALSFIAFNLLSVPCMAAVATAKAELKSGKWLVRTVCLWLATAWITSFLVFRISSLFV